MNQSFQVLASSFENDEDDWCPCKSADCHLWFKHSERPRSDDKLQVVRKVTIVLHCAKRSAGECGVGVRVKVTVSHKIKPSPVKASGPEHGRPGLSQGCATQTGGTLECILRDRHWSTLWASMSLVSLF